MNVYQLPPHRDHTYPDLLPFDNLDWLMAADYDDSMFVLGAVERGTMHGFLTGCRMTGIHGIEVSKNARKCGVGRMLVAHWKRYYMPRVQEMGPIRIDAVASAVGFWEKQGFVVDATFRHATGYKRMQLARGVPGGVCKIGEKACVPR